MKWLVPFGLFALVFVLPAFLLASWLLLVAPQPIWVKLFAGAVLALAVIPGHVVDVPRVS